MNKKAVLITGGARRLGRSMAEHFGTAGYDIALHYAFSEDDAQELQQSLTRQSVHCQLFQADLRQPNAAQELIKRVHHRMPHFRVLVNNASTFQRISFANTTPEQLDEIFAVNFKAPFLATQAFAKQVGQGAVVNMLDVSTHTNRTGYFAYLLAKKALADFTHMAARELAPAIRVNGIMPGVILPSGGMRDMDDYEKALPLRAKAGPEDIARAALLLAEEPYMVGQMLYVDGGEHLIL